MVKNKLSQYEFKIPKPPLRLDASKINVFGNCPVQFLFRTYSTLKIEQTTWPNTLFGTTAHKIVENALIDLNHNVPIEVIIKRNKEGDFEKQFFKYKERAGKTFKESRYYEQDEFIKQGIQYTSALLRFVGSHFNYSVISMIHPELKFTALYDFLDGITVVGKIDMLIFYKDGSYDIYDLKTTTNHNQYLFVDWDMSIQGMMYEYLTLRRFCDFANSFSYLVLNKDEKMLFLKTKIIQSQNIINEYDAEKYFKPLTTEIRMIQKFLSLPLEKQIKFKCESYNQCKWCTYKKYCSEL